MYRIPAVRILILAVSFLLAACTPPTATPPTQPPPNNNPSSSLPDLVVTDIINRDNNPNDDDVIINTTVRNDGASSNQDFIVRCSFLCSGNYTFFSGMKVTNGLSAGQEVTLGDDSLLYLGDCTFASSREFTCEVDPDRFIQESNEDNNTRTENILTGR